MTTPSRNRKINEQQKSALLEFISSHEELKLAKFTKSFTHKTAQQHWQDVTAILNAIPGGAKKNWNQWRKTWQDIRSKVKGKHAALKKYKEGTGGDAVVKEVLTSMENKVFELMCPTSIKGIEDIAESAIVYADNRIKKSTDSPILSECCDAEVAGSSTDALIPEANYVPEVEKTSCSLGVLQKSPRRQLLKESIKASKSLVDIGTTRNETLNSYYQQKLEVMKESNKLKAREISALERIALNMERIVDTLSSKE